MKAHRQTKQLLAAAGTLLAALFISGCGAEAAQVPEAVTLTSTTNLAAVVSATSTIAAPTAISAVATVAPASSSTPTPMPTEAVTTVPPATLTLPPTETAVTRAQSQSASAAEVQVPTTTITLPTYPIWDYLVEQMDPVYNMPVLYFNRSAYEAAGPTPTPKDYTGVVLENSYLRLTFLPELGGRLYSAVVKVTGQEIFYHNPVVKPSRYGVLQPAEANWWLATGGMEWAYPTQEHGYRFGVPWQYTVEQSAEGATIILSDQAPDRVGAEVRVFLPSDSAAFIVRPTLTNPTAQAVPVQFWLNAALTLGSASMSPQTQFVLPVDEVVVHSRGESGWTVPEARAASPWPLVSAANLRDYGQWANYLGVFAPNMEVPFVGAYNPETHLGVARLIEPGTVPGTKLFAFGQDFPDKSYTDDGSQYFEIWGGANIGFWPEADAVVPAGGTLAWQEQWWPLAGLGGLTWANQYAAIHVGQEGEEYTLSLLAVRPTRGKIVLLSGQTPLLSEPFTADPAAPLQWHFPSSAEPTQVQFTDEAGNLLLDYKICKGC